MLPQKYNALVSNISLWPLKCFTENENQHKFQGLNLGKALSKVQGQGLRFTP